MNRLTDPFGSSVVALGALALAGLVTIVLAWRGVAAQLNVANQVPFLVSGVIGGLALLGFASGVVAIQHRRYIEARRRAEFDEVIAATTKLLATSRQRQRMGRR